MDWIKRYGGWAVAVLAILYAANATSDGYEPAYYQPVAEVAASPASDSYEHYAQPAAEVAPPTPLEAAEPVKGWYDPRYVSCIANCANVEARIPSETEASTTPRLIYRGGADDPTAPPVESYSLPAAQPEQPIPINTPLYNAAVPVSSEPPAYYAVEPPATVPLSPSGACAENGSCYGDISPATGAPKTVAVRGYYRSDGTYVRGHYRSRPRN